MIKEELKIYLEKQFPACKVEETVDFPVLILEAEQLLPTARYLKENAETSFDFLFCQTAVDKLTHLEVVYHLTSTTFRHNLVLKVILRDKDNPQVESVTSLWKAAELSECEIFDLFGIRFLNHPTLRRIFLGNDWKGYPLRKDYKDDVNVLSL
jgi:NADH-quinone oxidoreductase subunit C